MNNRELTRDLGPRFAEVGNNRTVLRGKVLHELVICIRRWPEEVPQWTLRGLCSRDAGMY